MKSRRLDNYGYWHRSIFIGVKLYRFMQSQRAIKKISATQSYLWKIFIFTLKFYNKSLIIKQLCKKKMSSIVLKITIEL